MKKEVEKMKKQIINVLSPGANFHITNRLVAELGIALVNDHLEGVDRRLLLEICPVDAVADVQLKDGLSCSVGHDVHQTPHVFDLGRKE